MSAYSLQSLKVEIPCFVKERDHKGSSYYSYQIVITCPSPFKRWKVHRRFCQFLDLFAFFSGTRKIKTAFPLPSLLQFSWSKSALARSRIRLLEAFLKELLIHGDLVVGEMNRLYSFLDVTLDEDLEDRDSDFGDVRKQLFSDVGLPDDNDSDNSFERQSIGHHAMLDNSEAPQVEDAVVKLTDGNSFNSEFRPTDDLTLDYMSSSVRVIKSAVASYHLESETKERHYGVSVDGIKEALRNNDKKAVTELLRKNRSLARQVDEAGNPMIYTAALYGAIDLGITLIAAGADPLSVNRQGISAMDIAFDPWREAIQKYVDRLNEERLDAETCKYEIIETVVKKAPNGSLGLNIAKTTDGMPLVLGYSSSDDGALPPVASCDPPIKSNDIIVGVNNNIMNDMKSIVAAIRESAGGEVVLTLRRATATKHAS